MTTARDELAGVIGEKEFDCEHGIHIVGTGWIELPLYVRQELATAILAAGYVKPETVFVCSPDGTGGHEMDATALALIMANNTIARLTRELADVKPRVVTRADTGDTLARMVDPHAFDTAKWDARGEPNRLRRVRNAERRAENIIAWVKTNPGAIS